MDGGNPGDGGGVPDGVDGEHNCVAGIEPDGVDGEHSSVSRVFLRFNLRVFLILAKRKIGNFEDGIAATGGVR